MDSQIDFPHVFHQRVRLRVDTDRDVLHGVTEIYIRPGNHRVVALHARNLQIDEVRVGNNVVTWQWMPRHKQQSVGEFAEHSIRDFADYVTDDYRAALKADRTLGDMAILLGPRPTNASSPGPPKPLFPAPSATNMSPTPPFPPPPPRAAHLCSPSCPSEPASPTPGLTAHDFPHCSGVFRQRLLHDPHLAASIKLTLRYRKIGPDASVRYLAGLMTTDLSFNSARGLVPCVDLPSSLHSWEFAVEAGLCDVAVCSGALVSQQLLVGYPPEEEEEQMQHELREGRKEEGEGQRPLSVPGKVKEEAMEAVTEENKVEQLEERQGDAMEVDTDYVVAIEPLRPLPAASGAGQGAEPMHMDGAVPQAEALTVGNVGGEKGEEKKAVQWTDGEEGKLTTEVMAAAAPPTAPRTPRRLTDGAANRTPRPYAKVWYYELPLAVAPCQLHVTVGPLAVVPQYQGSTNQVVESFLKQQQPEAGGVTAGGGEGCPQESTVITHFGPPACMELIRSTTSFFYLPFKQYQIASTVHFPLTQLQLVFIPSELAVSPVQVAAGCIVVSCDLLHSDTAVEPALEGKIVLAEALARQWFGIILQPRSSSDVWLVDGLSGLLADHFLKAWLGQNEVAYRRFKEREAVLAGDDGQPPPLSPQNQYDDADEPADAVAGGGGAAAVGSQSQRRRRKNPLSQMYGSESLEPSPLRRWKAVVVCRMLERRTGEDSFRSIMQAVCRNAANAVRTWSPARGPGGRLLSTRRFIAECGSAAGMAKDVAAFAERWVYGRGCPRLTAGCSYVRRNNTLLLAIKQEGGPEVVAAGRSASAQRSKSETAGRGIKVAVYDHDGAVQEVLVERMEAHVDAVVHEIEIASKPGHRGRRGKRGGGVAASAAAAAAGGGGDDVDEEGGTQPTAVAVVDEHRIPVQYFRVDPGQEWLCDVVVHQSEGMWVAQLRGSKDVVAQSLAVQGLMRLGLQLESSGAADSSSVIGVLLDCVRSGGVYCRVKVEAARALAAFSASMSTQPAAPNLLSYFYDQCRDLSTGVLRPNHWADLGTHLVLQSIPACLATIRDVSFNSTPEAMQLVTDILINNDNSENLYDDSSYLAAVIEAAGLLRPTHASLLSRLLGLLDEYLLRELLKPSHNYMVGAACLAAMTALALSVNPRQGRGAGAEAKALELYASVRRQLLHFSRLSASTAAAASSHPDATSTPIPHTNAPTAAPASIDVPSETFCLHLHLPQRRHQMLQHQYQSQNHPQQQQQQGQACEPPHHLLRRAAYQCLLRLEAGEAKVMSSRRGVAGGGLEAKPASRVVSLALRLLSAEPLPVLRLAVMMEMLALLTSMQARVLQEAREEGSAGEPGALTVPVSPSAAAALYHLALREGEEPRVRHSAFLGLQLLTSQPPTLFRASPEDALAADEPLPEPSNVTGRAPPRSHMTSLPPHAAAAAAAGGLARSVGTGCLPDGTAGTAATAAQAAPALKRIKIAALRPGPGIGSGLVTASGSALSGVDVGSAAVATVPYTGQPVGTESRGRSPALSSGVTAPPPTHQAPSQGARAVDATATTRPEGSAASPALVEPTSFHATSVSAAAATRGTSPSDLMAPASSPRLPSHGPHALTAAITAPGARSTANGRTNAASPPLGAWTAPSGSCQPTSVDALSRRKPAFGASPLRSAAAAAAAVAGSPSPPRPSHASASPSPRRSSGGGGSGSGGGPREPPPPPPSAPPPASYSGRPAFGAGRGRSTSPTEPRVTAGVPKPKLRPVSGSAAASSTPAQNPVSSPTFRRAASGPLPPPPLPRPGTSLGVGGGTVAGDRARAAAQNATSPARSGASTPSPPLRRPPPPPSQPPQLGSQGPSSTRLREGHHGQVAPPPRPAAPARGPPPSRPPAAGVSATTAPAAGAGAVPFSTKAPLSSSPTQEGGSATVSAVPARKWPTGRASRPTTSTGGSARGGGVAVAGGEVVPGGPGVAGGKGAAATAALQKRKTPFVSAPGQSARTAITATAVAPKAAKPTGAGSHPIQSAPKRLATSSPPTSAGTLTGPAAGVTAAAGMTGAGKPVLPVKMPKPPTPAAVTAAPAPAPVALPAAVPATRAATPPPPPAAAAPPSAPSAPAAAAAAPLVGPQTAAPAAHIRTLKIRIKNAPPPVEPSLTPASGARGGTGSAAPGGVTPLPAVPITALSRRQSIAGSTGAPPPLPPQDTPGGLLSSRASASKPYPPTSTPTCAPAVAAAPAVAGVSSQPPGTIVPVKIRIKIKGLKVDPVAPPPAVPTVSTASAAPLRRLGSVAGPLAIDVAAEARNGGGGGGSGTGAEESHGRPPSRRRA